MEAIDSILTAIQTAPQTQTAQSAGGKRAPSDDFRKLMDRQTHTAEDAQAADKAPRPQAEEKEAPMEGETAPFEDERELEQQMVLAAMAVVQSPATAVEAPVTVPEEAAVAVAPAAAEAVQTVETALPRQVQSVQTREDTPVQTVQDQQPQAQEAPAAEQAVQAETPETQARPQEQEDPTDQGSDAPAAERPAEARQEEEAPRQVETEAPVFREVREIPVKVGEAPRTEKAPVAQQILPKVHQALADGETHVELQLEPESLGKISVELVMRRDGGLVVQIHAENSRTESLLAKDAGNLAALIGRDAAQEVRVEVPRQEDSQRQDLYDQQQQQRQQQQQQQQQRQERRGGSSEDFLHQLRLGLVPAVEE